MRQTIGRALRDQWKKEKATDTDQNKVVPLEYYLRYNYQERYAALCQRCGVEPVSFGRWLLRDLSTI